MEQELSNKLNRLNDRIRENDYLEELDLFEEWGGADVILSNQLDDRIKIFLSEQPIVISSQEEHLKRRAVITEYSKELSWLFYQLKKIFSGKVDYISKYDFYGLLAQTANDYLQSHKGNVKREELLIAVLEKARSFPLE